jgi:predicted transcriptional regulator
MIGVYFPSVHYTRRILADKLTWIYRKHRPHDGVKKILICRASKCGASGEVLAEADIVGACFAPSWSMWKLTSETPSKKPERFRWDFKGVENVYGVNFKIIKRFCKPVLLSDYKQAGVLVLVSDEKSTVFY